MILVCYEKPLSELAPCWLTIVKVIDLTFCVLFFLGGGGAGPLKQHNIFDKDGNGLDLFC